MELIVKARNIDIEYNGKQILDIDDLEIYSYDKIGIVGKNGVGKTTLLKILLEQIKLEKAEIKIVDAEAELDVNLPEARLIFVKPNGQFRGTETPRHAYKVINYELKIPSRFHDFRDTHATRLIEQGADIKAVSKRLGHSTIMTTYNIYVRVTEKMETDTVDRFENYTNSLDIPNNEEILYKD